MRNTLLHWSKNHKHKQTSSWLDIFLLLVANPPVRTQCTISVISINARFVLLIVVFQGGLYQIFHIWNNRLLCYPFWDIHCWPIRLITIKNISIVLAIPFNIVRFPLLVTSCNCFGRLLSTRFIVFPTVKNFETSCICSLDEYLFNFSSEKIQWQRLILILLSSHRF